MVARSVFVAAISCFILGFCVASQAEGNRDGKWEASMQVFFTGKEKVSGANQSSIDIDGDFGVGFGFAFNLTQAFSLGLDLSYYKPAYQAVFNTDEVGLVAVDHEMNVNTGMFSATWHAVPGPLTPFVRVGMGWAYIDSNISDGPPVTGCWWDPWYGYICRNYYDTYDDTAFTYGAGVGFRVEFDRHFFARGSINYTVVEAENDFDPGVSSIRCELGWMF
ncbi:porin family protein [Aestuariicella hydrocarbonica]|uniref:Porin family protein n=1 Tax=Pseudomaricurvus hydrocarbonicus TaxID=1470433 RepID=A0A9E5JTX7_9GAMM|nr:outer membrane beta-barrel protein [Aestuariicella hydrocarbonica]NHO65431.1 porin family protein [Aestuariicella hydrocarbonica]